jgi:hypothetical protein
MMNQDFRAPQVNVLRDEFLASSLRSPRSIPDYMLHLPISNYMLRHRQTS